MTAPPATDATATTGDGPSDTDTGAFALELSVRFAEARASLHAAEALDEPEMAQVHAADLADLESIASRNDLDGAPADELTA